MPSPTLKAAPQPQRLMPLDARSITWITEENFDCPHCKRQQVVRAVIANFVAVSVEVRQCLGCTQVEVKLAKQTGNQPARQFPFVVFPRVLARPAKAFKHLPNEVRSAYVQACQLLPVHAGAAGAYARRALEIVLDGMGHQAPTMLKSIELARSEDDQDRRLPRRLLDQLDYVKEVGNFALHVRRNGELSIIEISKPEVEACLTIIEDILTFVFEEPGDEQDRRDRLNEQLAEAKKKPLPQSEAEPLWDAELAARDPDEPTE